MLEFSKSEKQRQVFLLGVGMWFVGFAYIRSTAFASSSVSAVANRKRFLCGAKLVCSLRRTYVRQALGM